MALLAENRDLRERFRAGEAAALEVVYRRYVRDVTRLIRFGFVIDKGGHVPGVLNPDDQLDLAQEVFTRAFSERARLAYDGLRPYRPYLLRIAKNYLIDRARRSGRELLAKTEEQALQIESIIEQNAELPSVEGDLDWQRQRQATVRYMESLTDELRRFVELRFVERHPQAKVAEQMGTSRRQVMNMEASTLRKLKVFLKKEGVL